MESSSNNGSIIGFFKKAGIVAGASLALIALSTTLMGFLTAPIYRKIDAEANVRATVDSLSFTQMNKVLKNQVLLAEALLETDPRVQRKLLRRIEVSYEGK